MDEDSKFAHFSCVEFTMHRYESHWSGFGM